MKTNDIISIITESLLRHIIFFFSDKSFVSKIEHHFPKINILKDDSLYLIINSTESVRRLRQRSSTDKNKRGTTINKNHTDKTKQIRSSGFCVGRSWSFSEHANRYSVSSYRFQWARFRTTRVWTIEQMNFYGDAIRIARIDGSSNAARIWSFHSRSHELSQSTSRNWISDFCVRA